MVTWIILSDMKKSIDILLKSLDNQQITKHIVCPSATLLLSKFWMSLPTPIEIIDERSAGYVATGLCAETEAPVVVWCADNDAYRNLTSALTEAYYRKLPILVIALACDANINQAINPQDTIRYYVNNPTNGSKGTEADIEQALEYLYADVKGPVYLSLRAFKETANIVTSRCAKCIDATAVVRIIPPSASVHVGMNVICDSEHLNEVISRNNHCTKDGNLSMLIGSSVVARDQLHVGLFSSEELAYDLNMFGNRHVDGNIVIFSFISEDQAPAIFDVAKRFGWDCRQINITEIDSIKDKFVISDKPQYIEVTL